MNNEALLKVDISRNKTLEFFEEYLTYQGNRIFYADIDGVSYLWTRTRHSIYFVPVGTSNSYVIQIRHQNKTEKINLAGFLGKESERQGNFALLIKVIDSVMKPNVVRNLLKQIQNQGVIKIGNLEINREGITKSTFFSKDFLKWSEYFNTILDKGNVFVYKNVNGKAKVFSQQSMGNINAVVLPDLLLVLFHSKGDIESFFAGASKKIEKTEVETNIVKEETPKKSEAVVFCNQCGNKINSFDKFCGKCGSPINR